MRKLRHSIVGVVCGAALFTAGVALASNPGHPNNGHGTTTTAAITTTGTTSTNPSTPKAWGVACKSLSKKHVAGGQKGTPFSQCVTAMAKAAHGVSFKAACAALSKKHRAGQKGTDFSLCVSAAAKLLGTH